MLALFMVVALSQLDLCKCRKEYFRNSCLFLVLWWSCSVLPLMLFHYRDFRFSEKKWMATVQYCLIWHVNTHLSNPESSEGLRGCTSL